ncbi:MAG TPA: polysaccharide pyruvyl transferase family protein [Adlercreutzia equolifaciens]|uniref:polysaccharide pyruvyl transferase family protein n=1 Tax=Adlercreutzia equolifaciens TaxID=446660 RepID=UPI00242DBC60|nr:polysaccharide pyruvyl transferase family protein [Adlercreutzia equolifaciens]HJI12211.1 polysaccharide pyruvyl transferase family protein [Adlercreutzia equolifaciens]
MYHRFVLLANPTDGSASLSWRAKCALENLGHTVFWFDSQRHPFLFSKDGEAADITPLARFLERQQPDGLIVADGVLLTEAQRNEAMSLASSMIVMTLDELCDRPLIDDTYLATPLANTIAYPPRLICLQDATPKRIEALRTLAPTAKELKLPIRCTGEGWPKEWQTDKSLWNGFVYTSRSAVAQVHFTGEGAAPQENLSLLTEADGAPVILWDETSENGAPAAERALRDLVAKGLPLQSRRLAAWRDSGADFPTLETAISSAIDRLEKPEPGRSGLSGTGSPRTIISILGYFGMGNYGDELILDTLDERIRAAVEGSSVVAVSENPQHTLVERGIYAITLKDIIAVDRALAYSSAALVVAGLLFDQGIRWTAGKAETFTSARVSDIPGIVAYASLAAANDTPVVFHGIGAGPLEVLDGRQLVKLMGRQGALFTPRDRETGDLIRSCGVPASQVIEGADTIFLTADETAEPPQPAATSDAPQLPVAISLREYENTPADFPARMAHALDIVAEAHPDARFAFCILDPGDRALAEKVIAVATCKQQCSIQDYGNDLSALTAFLKGARAGFSMRYHSALVISAAGIPCVGMDYLPKVAALYEDLGIADLLVPPTATAEQCATALRSALENADAWHATLCAHIAPLQAASHRAFDLLLERIENTRPAKSGIIPAEFFLNSRPFSHRRTANLEKSLAETKAERDALKAECAQKDKEIAALKKQMKEASTSRKRTPRSIFRAVKRRTAGK